MLTRRELLTSSLLTTSAILSGQQNARRRPNILILSCEDTSPDLGCYGVPEARTPNLDRFATQGVRYTNAYSVYGVCAPSRSSIITAMYPASIGTQHMRSEGVPPPHVRCFTEYLRAAGYYTTNNVKTDYNFASPPSAWDENSNKAHWRNRPAGMPFYSVFNIVTTHESQIRAPETDFQKQTARLKQEDRHDPAKAQLPPYYPDTPVVRQDWARYFDLVTAMDLQMADLLKQLEEDGLADNTIVFFWGDHGRGLPRAKRWIYDSGIQVPFLVRWPGVLKPGTVSDRLISLMDLGPTCLSIAGIQPPAYMQGRAFLGDFAAGVKEREYIHAARDRMDETYDIIRGVRDKRYKYIRNFQPGKPYVQYIDYMEQMPTMRELRRLNKDGKLEGPQRNFFAPEKPKEELYDTSSDPHEVSNLAEKPEHQKTLARMRAELERWMKDIHDTGLMPEAELKERMRPGGVWQTTAVPQVRREGEFLEASCSTPGSSIVYALGDEKRWRLYTGKFKAAGKVRFLACRLGFRDSAEVMS
jgi:N-sulfoglucosamine sulfohydrolase